MFECDCSSDNSEPPCRGSSLDPDSRTAAEGVTHRGCLLYNPASLRFSIRRPNAPRVRRHFNWPVEHTECDEIEPFIAKKEKSIITLEDNPESPPLAKPFENDYFFAGLNYRNPRVSLF